MQSKPQQKKFFIPFKSYKGFDSGKIANGGNLSNMRTHTMNISVENKKNISKSSYRDEIKNKIFGIDSKSLNKYSHRETNLNQSNEGSKVQSRLKKLIGRGKQQVELGKRKNNSKLKLNQSNNSYVAKDNYNFYKDEKQRSRKKDIKINLNLSSENTNQFNIQVESYLNSKFPQTAPHNNSKEKKLFSNLKKANTPKYNKKPLRGNLALITALTNSNRTNNLNLSSNFNSKGLGVSRLVSSKLGPPKKPKTSHNLQTRKSHKESNSGLVSRYFNSTQYASPHLSKYRSKEGMNKSNYSSKNNQKSGSNSRISLASINNSGIQKRKNKHQPLSSYLKNNFFIRNNYNKNSSKRSSKNGSKNGSRLGIKSNSRSSKLGPRTTSKYSDLGISKQKKGINKSTRQVNTSSSNKLNKNSKKQQSSRLLLNPLDKLKKRQTRTSENSKLSKTSHLNKKFTDLIPKFNSSSSQKLLDLEFDLINSTQEIVFKIYQRVQKDFEIYDFVKEYVDIVQEQDFGDFWRSAHTIDEKIDELNSNDQFKQILKTSLIFERWAMFFIFYFYFNEKILKKYVKEVKKLINKVKNNSGLIVGIWGVWAHQIGHSSLKYLGVKMTKVGESTFEKLNQISKFSNVFQILHSNNLEILQIFDLCFPSLSKDIQSGISTLKQCINAITLKQGLELCLDSFCQFLIEKGVVSVEYSNDQLDDQIESKNNGIVKSSEIPKQTITPNKKPNSKTELTNMETTDENSKDTPQTETTKNTVSGSRQKLKQPDSPFLPPTKEKYCLVLDLDETLVHYEDNGITGQFYLRPYAQEFIDEMSKYYEVVIFTAALQDYADWILNRLDSNKSISYRLYRQHTSKAMHSHVKDLSKLGRNLEKTIIVDNIPENFQLQPENGIYIKSWFKDPDDCALMELMPLLKEIVLKNFKDVRIALQKFRDKMIENIKKGCLQPHLNLTLD